MKVRKYVNRKNFVALMLVYALLAPQLSVIEGINFATVDMGTSVDQVIKSKGAQVDVAYLTQLNDHRRQSKYSAIHRNVEIR